ncbi:Aste57867_18826 [Aphanomyces stellatus]|uniref:Aste57867_18826 protein n=1 Tax=Aphanomyces stellatus TaxID=120398 RepID=A0A485LBC8_9STRA|nr:hypothetical protein As57867_018762 [Aphanomyces stellatus]VFT95560.1 Aste57867_18826 [Aphanomyces stellatus]
MAATSVRSPLSSLTLDDDDRLHLSHQPSHRKQPQSPIPLLAEKQPKKESRTIASLKNSLRSFHHKAVNLFDDTSFDRGHGYGGSTPTTSGSLSRTSSQVTAGCPSPSEPSSRANALLQIVKRPPAASATDDADDDRPVVVTNGFVLVRDFTPDPRKLVQGRGSSAFVRALIRANMIDCVSCKWAPSYFSYVSYGVRRKQLTTLEANSVRWLICQYIIVEASRRNAVQQTLRDQLTRKLTDFRIAVQCVSGMAVVKYGRKGKPHTTQLMVENADSIRWTPKLGHHLTNMLQQQKQKSISLSTVISIQSGIKSDVFRKAFKESKGTLDPACCLSLVTPTRSLDVLTSSRQQCDWLRRSIELMVAQAHENEKKASAHVETSIMKKLASLTVYKHGRKGKPHKTTLHVDKYGEVTWKGKSGGAILLQEVTELRLGHGTAVLERAATTKSNPKHCVSLITAARTLDLELHSESERDYVVIAFRYLLNKMRDRAREAKRMKAERGVRMLQEAYQYHARHMQVNQTQPVGYDLERYPGAPPSPTASASVALERHPSAFLTAAPTAMPPSAGLERHPTSSSSMDKKPAPFPPGGIHLVPPGATYGKPAKSPSSSSLSKLPTTTSAGMHQYPGTLSIRVPASPTQFKSTMTS